MVNSFTPEVLKEAYQFSFHFFSFILNLSESHLPLNVVHNLRSKGHLNPGFHCVADLENLHVTFLNILTDFSVVLPLFEAFNLLVPLVLFYLVSIKLRAFYF